MSPVEVMAAIDRACRDLDGIGRELSEAIIDLGHAEMRYGEAVEKAKLELFDEYRRKGERMPAEDMRNAMAHRRIVGSVYADYLIQRARSDALKAHARAIEHALSGRQSLLGAMKAEMVGAA